MTVWGNRIGALAGAALSAGLLGVFPVRACPPEATETRALTAIASGNSLTLDDGTELRLSSILLPTPRDLPAPSEGWPLQSEAEAALDRFLASRTLKLAATGSFRDRYGRRVAHAISADGLWVQSAMVDEGLARVVPLPGELDCVRELYAREAVARAKRVGLWANPAYAIRQARHTRTLERLMGTFQIVEGWVAEVGATRSEVFLNFGRNWRWDFTAAVDLRRAPDRDAIAARLKRLKGRFVRVRGFVERRNGPFIGVASADVIEDLPEGSASGR